MFEADRNLLAAFLDAYGVSAAERRALPRKAMSVALLHEFALPQCVAALAGGVSQLEELAEILWST